MSVCTFLHVSVTSALLHNSLLWRIINWILHCLRVSRKKQSKQTKETLSPINLLHSSFCLFSRTQTHEWHLHSNHVSSPPPCCTSSFHFYLPQRALALWSGADCCICGCTTSCRSAPCLGTGVREERGRRIHAEIAESSLLICLLGSACIDFAAG